MDIYSDFTLLHFDLSEIIAFASYLPVTSESGPLPLDYSSTNVHIFGKYLGIYYLVFISTNLYHLIQSICLLKLLLGKTLNFIY